MVTLTRVLHFGPQKWLFVSLAGAAIWLAPAKTEHSQFRSFRKALTIQTSRKDPPRVAFNEVMAAAESSPAKESPPSVQLDLNSKSESNQKQGVPPQATNIRKLTLKPLLISQNISKPAETTEDDVEAIGDKPNIIGGIRLEEGLYLGDGYIDVRHVENGISKSAGKTNPKKGSYLIEVPDYNGTLVASLYTKEGEKIGEGSLRLSEVSPTRFGTTDISMRPIQQNFAIRPVDFSKTLAGPGPKRHYGDERGLGAKAFFPGLESEGTPTTDGVAKMPNVAKGSWTIARAELEGYTPTAFLIPAGQENKTPLFKQSFTKALLSISQDLKKQSLGPETNSIVWGQTIQDGKPAHGVSVSVEFQDTYQVIYFNQLMLPDPTLTATGENGYFAVLHLPEGIHAIIARRGEAYFSHANVYTEPETSTAMSLVATTHVEPTEIKVYDAFVGEPASAQLELQSLAEPIEVSGLGQAYLQQIERLSFMNVRPESGDYFDSLMSYSDKQDSIYIPLIRRAWIQAVIDEQKVNVDGSGAIIVGFVQEQNFDVYLPFVNEYSSSNIVYFDSKGEISKTGKAGGGFILFNVPEGLQSVVVVSQLNSLMNAQIVPMDAGGFATLQFRF